MKKNITKFPVTIEPTEQFTLDFGRYKYTFEAKHRHTFSGPAVLFEHAQSAINGTYAGLKVIEKKLDAEGLKQFHLKADCTLWAADVNEALHELSHHFNRLTGGINSSLDHEGKLELTEIPKEP